MCWLLESRIQFHVKHTSSICNTPKKVADATSCCSSHSQNSFSAHNPVEVAELEYAVCGTDAAVDHATPPHTTFHWEMWWQQANCLVLVPVDCSSSMQCVFYISSSVTMVYQCLAYLDAYDQFLADDVPEKCMFGDLDVVIADTF